MLDWLITSTAPKRLTVLIVRNHEHRLIPRGARPQRFVHELHQALALVHGVGWMLISRVAVLVVRVQRLDVRKLRYNEEG